MKACYIPLNVLPHGSQVLLHHFNPSAFRYVPRRLWMALIFSLVIIVMIIVLAPPKNRKNDVVYEEIESPKFQANQNTINANQSKSRSKKSSEEDTDRKFACYRKSEDMKLDDIFEREKEIDPTNGIFFIETSCFANKVINLNARQICAIESTAIWNRDRNIFVLFASSSSYPSEVPPVLAVLKSYPNVYLMHLDVDKLITGTAAEEFYKSGQIFESKYLIAHFSDLLRLLVLNRFGGIYLDLDVVLQKSMDQFSGNFVGKESRDSINQAVIGMERNGKISHTLIKDYADNFEPSDWSHNGPKLFVRVLEKECSKKVAELTTTNCDEFKTYPISEFYAVDYTNVTQFTDPQATASVLEATKDSTLIHTLYHLSRENRIKKSDDKTAYGIIAKKNCPHSYEAAGDYF